MLLGLDTIEDGADVVGLAFPGALACDEAEVLVAFEFWTKHIVGSGQDGLHPWVHWVFPQTVWQLGDNTAEEDFVQLTVNGFSRTNTCWGEGPYGDGPPDDQDIREGGVLEDGRRSSDGRLCRRQTSSRADPGEVR